MSLKTGNYQLFERLIAQWKPRAKKIKVPLKKIASDAGIKPQHISKILSGKYVKNPRITTIDAVEAALDAAEKAEKDKAAPATKAEV